MKKLLLFVLVAIVAVALVACGGETTTEPETTTTEPTTTTTEPTTTTTEPTTTTTTEPETDTTTEPEVAGYDLVEELYVIDPWSDLVFFTFEESHGDLDFHPAIVFKMNNSNQVYEELFITEKNEDGSWNTGAWKANDEFTWFFYVDDKKIECTRFSLFNYGDSGYVRADLGADFSYNDFEYDEENIHNYTVKFEILDSQNEVVYYGNLTPYGEFAHTKPAVIEMVVDPDRDGGERVGASVITPISGPQAGGGEGFEKLFDNDVRSKLCTGSHGIDNPVILTFNTPQKLSGISLVNGNDNQTYTDRTVLSFDIYLSEDGQNWEETPAISFTGVDADGNPLDLAAHSTNYGENYFAFDKVLENVTYVKFVVTTGAFFQISELIFWQG